MTTEHQNEDRELTDNELAAISGGALYIPPPPSPTGFGVRTDAIIAFKNANHLSLTGPTLTLP